MTVLLDLHNADTVQTILVQTLCFLPLLHSHKVLDCNGLCPISVTAEYENRRTH